MPDKIAEYHLERLKERARKATPELHIPARFTERARLDRLDWIAKASAGGRRALEHCRKFARDPGRTKAPMLTGKSGAGKTHLLYAMAREVHERMVAEVEARRAGLEKEILLGKEPATLDLPVRRICLTSGAEIGHEIRESIQRRNLDAVVSRYRQLNPGLMHGFDAEAAPPPNSTLVLLVDDIEVCKLGEWVGEAVYRIFDFRYAENLPTVVASNLSVDELLQHFGDRIARRIFDLIEPFEL